MNQTEQRRFGGAPFYILLLLAIVVATYFLMTQGNTEKKDTLSDVLSYLDKGDMDIKDVSLEGYTLKFTYKDADGKTVSVSKSIPPLSTDRVVQALADAKAAGNIDSYDYKEPPDYSSILNIGMIVILIAAMGFFLWFD